MQQGQYFVEYLLLCTSVLDIGENDFSNLKREQSLLVDFNIFPSKIIELLEHCSPNVKSHSQSSIHGVHLASTQDMSSSFIVKLDATTGVLSIVETNLFKQLTHISLQMRPGNDAAVKVYLASRLNQTCAQARRLMSELESAHEQLQYGKTRISELSEELQKLKYLILSVLLQFFCLNY